MVYPVKPEETFEVRGMVCMTGGVPWEEDWLRENFTPYSLCWVVVFPCDTELSHFSDTRSFYSKGP